MGTELSSSVANRQIRRYLLEFWLPTVASVLRCQASVRDELRDEKPLRRQLREFSMPFLGTLAKLGHWNLECVRPLRNR